MKIHTFGEWQVVLMKDYLRSSDRAVGGASDKKKGWGPPLCTLLVHSLLSYVDLYQCLFCTCTQAEDAKNVPLHRWWHIRDSYCNITRSYRELSRHSASVRVPQAYHFYLMNGGDWIGRQRWGVKGADDGEGRGGGTRAPCSLILPCLFLRLSAMIFQHKIKIDK